MGCSFILTLLIRPTSPEELARVLADACRKKQSIRLIGNGSKDAMGGPLMPADVTITTRALNRLLKYEPRDLTIRVEAGMRWRELTLLLAANRQMIPLDPPFSGVASVGGVVATNSSGPRRRLYGTARDMVIGMTFATLEGKLIDTGGMVVKNVAGLDMGKLMIGSCGTLAALTAVNFRLYPMPQFTRTFRWCVTDIAKAFQQRDAILKSVLQPMALDIVKARHGYTLLMQAGGSSQLLDRYSRELASADVLEGGAEREAWREIRQFTPLWLLLHPEGAVVRVSSTLSDLQTVMQCFPSDAIARAGNGVCYGYFSDSGAASAWLASAPSFKRILEYGPQFLREKDCLWPEPGKDFVIMKMIKAMFDRDGLLNRGRLYGRI